MKRIAALLLTLPLLAACAPKEEKRIFFAMDTVMEITAFGPEAAEAISAAESELFRLDSLLSRGNEDSEVYALNAAGGGEASPETAELISRALELGASTDWAFDITVAPLMDLWGFYDQNYRVPSEAEIAAALPIVGGERVGVSGARVELGGGRIDLGGIAKGWASGQAAELLRERGITSALLNLGGNIQAIGSRGGKPWRVAVQNPDGGEYIGVLSLTDACAVTSGDYQRFFEDNGKIYHHIIDPKTGYPAESGLRSVTVVCADPALADGLSTALFVMGMDKALEFWRTEGGFEAVFVAADGGVYVTAGLGNCFERAGKYEIVE